MDKSSLRTQLRATRAAHVAALPDTTRALIFLRPPGAVQELVPDDAVVGLYHATKNEAPAGAYARFFAERGHTVALPRFTGREAPMDFALHQDPFDKGDLVETPSGIMQPGPRAQTLVPDVLFVPLLGFTERGERIGQGAGHYDRWLAEHPNTVTIGMAWDAQLVDELPTEAHDVPLTAVVTPTRLYGPFDRSMS